jgi:tetratricopeptide (TPR) repeat protein
MTTRCLLVISSLLAAGCLAHPRSAVEKQMEVVERERQPERLIARARLFVQLGDYTRAEQYLNAALENGEAEAEVLPMLLAICVKDRRYRAAVQYGEDYLRKHPRQHRLRFVVASLYIGLGEVEPARAQLERLLADDPKHAEAHYALAVLLRDQLKSAELADRHFRNYLSLDPRGQHAEEATGSLLTRMP